MIRSVLYKEDSPLLKAHISSNPVDLLLDTGAYYSVYTRNINVLMSKFPDIFKTEDYALIGGFGHGKSRCSIYIIPKLCIDNLVVYNLPVAYCPRPYISAELVLASNIFKKTPFRIDYQNQIIEFDSKTNQIWCNYKTKDSIWISTYVFTQNPNS